MNVRTITVAERRARLGQRHALAAGGVAGAAAAAAAVVALHSTDPASVFLSLYARDQRLDVAAIEDALYEDRSLVRLLGMRRTVFVVPVDTAPVIQASSTRAIADKQRRLYTKFLVEAGVGDGAFLADVEAATARALAKRGVAAGAELSADEPRLRTQVLMAPGKPYESRQNITTWVLFLLAADGLIVRGRPRGSWTSTQWQWSPIDTWLPGGMPDLPVAEAQAALVRRWLAAYGPGTEADLKWWTGWPAGQVRKAITAVGAVAVDLAGDTGYVLADDLDPVAAPPPWVALLPALDPTPMGWTQRSWYVGPHTAALFDRSGNIGPTVWSDGRIVGGWAQRPDGDIVYRLLEDIGSEATAAVAQSAADTSAWIGDVRVTPRFRTPLEKELTS